METLYTKIWMGTKLQQKSELQKKYCSYVSIVTIFIPVIEFIFLF